MARGRPRQEPGTWGAITAHERSGGKWRAKARLRYRGGETKEIARHGSSKTAAIKALTSALRIEATKHSPGSEAVTGVGDASPVTTLVTAYIEAKEKDEEISSGTARIYRSSLARHIAPKLGGLAVREVSTPAIEAALRDPAKPGIWKTARALLGGAWRWGLQTGRITTPSPVPATATAAGRSARREPKAATPAQVKALIEAARSYSTDSSRPGPSTRAIWLPTALTLSVATGTRAAELVTTRWADLQRVDARGEAIDGAAWDDLTVGETTALTIHGVKKGTLETPDGVLGAAERRVTLPDFAVKALLAWREQQPTHDVFPWIFPTATGRHISTDNLARAWRGAREYAPETEIESNHHLRRSAATWVVAELGLETAQRFLGHAGQSVAERHYLGTELVRSGEAIQRRWDRG